MKSKKEVYRLSLNLLRFTLKRMSCIMAKAGYTQVTIKRSCPKCLSIMRRRAAPLRRLGNLSMSEFYLKKFLTKINGL